MKNPTLRFHTKLLLKCFEPLTDEERQRLLGVNYEWNVKKLLKTLSEHLTPRQYSVLLVETIASTTKAIGNVLGVPPTTVNKLRATAYQKIRQPWRLRKLRNQLGVAPILPKPGDEVIEWFPVSTPLFTLVKSEGNLKLGALANAKPFGFRKRHYHISDKTELEYRRLCDEARALLSL